MKRGLRVLASAGTQLLLSAAAPAQRPVGILKIGHLDSLASMSMLEKSTAAVNRPMIGACSNTLRSIVPELATRWGWNEEGTELTFRAARYRMA